MRYDESDQDSLERNGVQHENTPFNMMGGNKSDYYRKKLKGTELIVKWRFYYEK